MNEAELIASIEHTVKCEVQSHLGGLPLPLMASLDAVEGLCRRLVMAAARAVLDAWEDVLLQVVRALALGCPRCGATRKCKRRPGQPMHLRLLGLEVGLEKLYLECDCCDAPGVSITRLLTGLSNGDASMELKLVGAYCAAQQSYGKATKDLGAHHGQDVERTWLRRQTLEVEQLAKAYAEQERREALERLSGEARVVGVAELMLQGDGGSVRTGIDVERWRTEMRSAIWERDLERRNGLLVEARQHRVKVLPKDLDRCPLDALESYLCNNWERMHAARLKEMGVDFVSARAESQVRDRTKSRFAVPGAWRQENLEGKATLKAIIDDGRFDDFRRDCLEHTQTLFNKQLHERVQRALGEGRIGRQQADGILSLNPAVRPLDRAA